MMEHARRPVELGLPSQCLHKFVGKRGHTFSTVSDSSRPFKFHDPERCAQTILRLSNFLLGSAEDLRRL
ncbi:hypothetical protein SZN_26269 [Streptomyces zinciresistens K42]|uniref:Uncharacterized protein n=1 Tax=Streptomyces zinciresistens K42 TaxID=700597 RepID=G2GIB4_9ACTN|nr:hypothetical protein SZN_26269 [Streptomyces zinciresistens K42]